MFLQTPTGESPIAGSEDYITDYDTLYGHYGPYSWTLSLAARPDDTELAAHVALAAAWLAPYSDATPETHKTYPQPYDGDISVAEGSFRIPLLSHEQVLDPAFVGHWWSLVEDLPGDYYVFIPLRDAAGGCTAGRPRAAGTSLNFPLDVGTFGTTSFRHSRQLLHHRCEYSIYLHGRS